MTALYVVLGILAALLLLLWCPLVLTISYEEAVRAKVQYLFIVYPIAPPKKKKPRKEKQPPKKEKTEKPGKKSAIREIIDQKGLGGFLTMMRELARMAGVVLKRLCRHMVVKKFRLSVTICGEDAADTALRYGGACAVLYPAVSAIVSNTKCEHYQVEVHPAFNGEKEEIQFLFKARVALLFVLGSALAALAHYFRYVVAQRKQ
jgi:hypothetical protein